MNPVFNILARILSGIDRLIGGMDKSTLETVKQVGYLLAFVLVAGSVGFGIYKGKEAARIGAMPSFSSINEIFEVDVKRARKTPFSRTMVESGQINEIADPELRRILFPTQAGIEPSVGETIVEPEAGHKASVQAETDKLSEIDRTDEKPQKSDVKPLSKKDETSPPQTIPPDTDEGALPRKSGDDVRGGSKESDSSSISSGKTIRVHGKKSPKPLDRGPAVLDK